MAFGQKQNVKLFISKLFVQNMVQLSWDVPKKFQRKQSYKWAPDPQLTSLIHYLLKCCTVIF